MRFYLPSKLQNMKKKKNFKHLTDLIGKGINIQENPKSTKNKEQQFFLDIITDLCQLEAKSQIISSTGINVMEYEAGFLQVITSLLEKQFGEFKSQIIIDGEVSALIDENEKEHIIATPKQLYKFLKRYDGK